MSAITSLIISANIVSALTTSLLLYTTKTIFRKVSPDSEEKNTTTTYLYEIDMMDIPTKVQYVKKYILKEPDCDEFFRKALSEIISRIEKIQRDINLKIFNHGQKYLKNWRKLDISNEFIELRKSVTILDNRLELFFNH